MNPKKVKNQGINVGTSLILVAFVLLCLVAFAALSYSTAESDYQLSEQTLTRKEAYYNACNNAEHKLQTLDTLLLSCYKSAGTEADYAAGILTALSGNADYTLTTDTMLPTISFTVAVTEKEILQITLRTCYPAAADPSATLYTITSYRTELLPGAMEEDTIQQNGGLLF